MRGRRIDANHPRHVAREHIDLKVHAGAGLQFAKRCHVPGVRDDRDLEVTIGQRVGDR